MPGRCPCGDDSPLMLDLATAENIGSLVWIAEQSVAMLNSQSRCNGKIRERLREAALAKGFNRGSLLNYDRLARAVELSFGRPVLKKLGASSFNDGRPSAWIRRLLYAQLDGKRRSPSFLYLLVIGALFNSIEDFDKAAETDVVFGKGSVRNSYCKQASLTREKPIWTDDFFELLGKGLGISVVASKLGIPVYAMTREARQQGWRIPLSKQLNKKLGSKKIAVIKKDLRQGLVKKEVMRKHGCSEWALMLIELDEPGLCLAHKNAFQHNIQKKNRQRLRQLVKARPFVSRSDVLAESSGLYDSLLKHDREWFFKQIPRKERFADPLRKKRKEWADIDEKKADEVADCFDFLIHSTDKPVHATASAALKKAGMLKQYYRSVEHFPRIGKVLQEKTESRSDFIKRRLSWAVDKMAMEQTPISINNLRRVASLPAETVRGFSGFVTMYGIRIGVEIHEKSYFFLGELKYD